MKKKFIIATATVFAMAGCSASAVAAPVEKASTPTVKVVQSLWKDSSLQSLTLSATELAIQKKLSVNTTRINTVVKKLKKRVGKTWYVFSGATPSGWDCSGLVLWTYEQIGIKLDHHASTQKYSGAFVKKPKVGDIVAFGWKGYRGAQHVGIYIGNGMMIHAGGAPGERTAIVSVQKWAKGNGNTKVTYTRLLETF